MKRKKEFRAYLQNRFTNNDTIEAYISYCEKVEKAFGGKEIDEIIISHQNIANVRAKLSKITSSKRTIGDCITGLNRYLEFAFWWGMIASTLTTDVYSKGGTTNVIQEKIDVIEQPLVQYYSVVLLMRNWYEIFVRPCLFLHQTFANFYLLH